ncbi:DUF4190 domain-containing protein [Streptacidiphilus rugosus]|uniref:DUF4190 domain-containing protein n=1 Tax=Streptacidiphilus rugosus TaxID=405783 RepID=UPI00056D15D0|nr:DUF4190 domain-containing protein [Streptacidiphilus rugosus]
MSTEPNGLGGLPRFEHRTRPDEMLPPPSDVNARALKALMFSLVPGVSVLAILYAVIALGQISDTGQRGRSLAVIALVLGLGWVAAGIWLMALRN